MKLTNKILLFIAEILVCIFVNQLGIAGKMHEPETKEIRNRFKSRIESLSLMNDK